MTIDWKTAEGGRGTRYDPRDAIERLTRSPFDKAAWSELWDNLHHQGDVGIASYAAIPLLVDVCQNGPRDYNFYGLLGTIEQCRKLPANPDLPRSLTRKYPAAIRVAKSLALIDLESNIDPDTVQTALALVALTTGLPEYAALLLDYGQDDLAELLEMRDAIAGMDLIQVQDPQTEYLWNRIGPLFRYDSGHLSEVRIHSTDTKCLTATCVCLQKYAASGKDTPSKTSKPQRIRTFAANELAVQANLIFCGEDSPKHYFPGRLWIKGVLIPDIGVSVFKDEITLDYKSGDEWGRREVRAFFDLLGEISLLCPEIEIRPSESFFSSRDRDLFVQVLSRWCMGWNELDSPVKDDS